MPTTNRGYTMTAAFIAIIAALYIGWTALLALLDSLATTAGWK